MQGRLAIYYSPGCPEHLQDEAWRMLSSHEKAFGFDGRLGQYPSKVHIRTVQPRL